MISTCPPTWGHHDRRVEPIGCGSTISTLDVQRLVISLATPFGTIEIQVALKLTGAAIVGRGG